VFGEHEEGFVDCFLLLGSLMDGGSTIVDCGECAIQESGETVVNMR
jgi:hypothetical protein